MFIINTPVELWSPLTSPGNNKSLLFLFHQSIIQSFTFPRRETFLSGAAWLSDYINAMELGEEPVKPVILVGNKSDVENINIASREYTSWVEDNNILGFYEVSARNDSNVDLAINRLLQHIITSEDEEVK